MPGNVASAAPSGVLPQTLCAAFTEARSYPMLAAPYHDGTTERSIITDTVNSPASIRTWKLGKRLPEAQIIALRTFFEGQNGGLTPFYFYNPTEVLSGHAIGSNYDSAGVSTQGRHTVVFRGDWTESVGLPFTRGEISLAEIA